MPRDEAPPEIRKYVAVYTKNLEKALHGLEIHNFEIDCIHLNPVDAAIIAEVNDVSIISLRFKGYPVHLDEEIPRGGAGPITKTPEEYEGKSAEKLAEDIPRIFGWNSELN